MGGQQPISVVTDGDKSIRKSIKKFYPQAKQRLCKFHLEVDANTNVRDRTFLNSFKACMFMDCTPLQFEDRWAEVIRQFRLEDNE